MVGLTARNHDGTVLTCAATECSFNRGFACCAPYIVVSPQHPECETYTRGRAETGLEEPLVMVCRTTICEFNRCSRCVARGVTFDWHGSEADCATFRT